MANTIRTHTHTHTHTISIIQAITDHALIKQNYEGLVWVIWSLGSRHPHWYVGIEVDLFQYLLSNFYYLFVYPTRFSPVSPSKENFFFLNTEEWKLSGHLTWNAEKRRMNTWGMNKHIRKKRKWNVSIMFSSFQPPVFFRGSILHYSKPTYMFKFLCVIWTTSTCLQ